MNNARTDRNTVAGNLFSLLSLPGARLRVEYVAGFGREGFRVSVARTPRWWPSSPTGSGTKSRAPRRCALRGARDDGGHLLRLVLEEEAEPRGDALLRARLGRVAERDWQALQQAALPDGERVERQQQRAAHRVHLHLLLRVQRAQVQRPARNAPGLLRGDIGARFRSA
eukprot:1076326-Pyramimonas_sp.AAC.1